MARRFNAGDIYFLEWVPDHRWWRRLLAAVMLQAPPTKLVYKTVIEADPRTGAVLFH